MSQYHDLKTIDAGADLREALDIDSMDFLNFITAIHHRLGIAIVATGRDLLASNPGIEGVVAPFYF